MIVPGLYIDQPTKVHAMDLINRRLERLIAAAEKGLNRDLALELARIKFQINQDFYKRQRKDDRALPSNKEL